MARQKQRKTESNKATAPVVKQKKKTRTKPKNPKTTTPTKSQDQAPPPAQDDEEDDQFREVFIRGRLQTKWKPIKKTSMNYVDQLFEQTITGILNSTSAVNYNVIQDHLNALKIRCNRRLSKASAPLSTLGDYRSLPKNATKIEEQVTKTKIQLERLEQELETQERLKNQHDRDLEDYRSHVESGESSSKLHPLLEAEYESVLDLPKLPTRCQDLQSKGAQQSSIFVNNPPTDNRLHKFVESAAALADNLRH